MEKRILVPIDYTDVSRDLVKIANAWSQRTNARLYFLHVYKESLGTHDDESFLRSFLSSQGIVNSYDVIIEYGTPYQKIREVEASTNSDLILLGPHSHTIIGRLFLGSNTDYTIHHSCCPIYIHKRHNGEFNNVIIVPLDFTEINKAVVERADEWAQRTEAEIRFVHVANIPDIQHYNMEMNWDWDQKEIEEMKQDAQDRLSSFVNALKVKAKHQLMLEFGKPYKMILELQKKLKAKLIMMAAHSHSIAERLIAGSNTDFLLHHTECSMYVYKHPVR